MVSGTNRPDISIAIVNYNTCYLLAQCLRSMVAQSEGLTLEVFVVDNASTDGSRAMLRRDFPWVHLIENDHNVGTSFADNQALRASTGRTLLLLNPDTIITDRALIKMLAFMDDHPHIGACGPRLICPDGSPQRSTFPFPTILSTLLVYSGLFTRFPRAGRWLLPRWLEFVPQQTQPADWCSGACLMVSRACFDAVGGLDEGFFLYSDDVDWCRQMWEAKWPVVYYPEAVVVHYLGASQVSEGVIRRRLREIEGEQRFIRKWHSPLYAAVYHWMLRLCSLYRYGKRSVTRQRHPERAEQLTQELAYHRAILTGHF